MTRTNQNEGVKKHMIRLTEVTEENWMDAASLQVKEDQKGFVAPAVGILARGYVYRNCRGRVFVIQDDAAVVGVALVREFTEEPAGYDLQQFLIGQQYQGRGYGTAALKEILEELKKEGRYDHVELCVKKEDAAAIHLYEKAGFADSGYIDAEVPDALNMICYFRKGPKMDIQIQPMTRERMHEMYRGFTMDPAIFDDMELFEAHKDYVYDPQKVDALFDMRSAEEGSIAFAVMRKDKVIGEVGLRHASQETKECELSVHLQNDAVKNKGYGTQAEILAIDYAFDTLGMEHIFAESLVKNTRSQHILEKLGFRYTGEEEGFKQYYLEKEEYVRPE